MKPLFSLLLFLSSLQATIHVIGDSHSQEFANIQGCKIHYLGPRTMHRVGRDGLHLIDFQQLGIQEEDTVIFAFGEIDVRCHIGKQRDLRNRELNEIIETLITNYFKTITDNLSNYKHLNIITYTVTPPVLVAWNIEYESYGSLEDRVAISRLLNQKLIEMSLLFGFKTIDVYNDYADENGMLREDLSDGSVHIATSCNQAIKNKLFALIAEPTEGTNLADKENPRNLQKGS